MPGRGLAADVRPFSPHLTLARIKEGERQVGQVLAESGVLNQSLTCGLLEIKAVVMMKSQLRPTGSVYTRLWEARLKRGGERERTLFPGTDQRM